MNSTLIPTLCTTMKRWLRFQSWGWLANPLPFLIKTKLKKPIQGNKVGVGLTAYGPVAFTPSHLVITKNLML